MSDQVVHRDMIQKEDVWMLNEHRQSLKQPSMVYIKRLTDEP